MKLSREAAVGGAGKGVGFVNSEEYRERAAGALERLDLLLTPTLAFVAPLAIRDDSRSVGEDARALAAGSMLEQKLAAAATGGPPNPDVIRRSFVTARPDARADFLSRIAVGQRSLEQWPARRYPGLLAVTLA